MLSLSLSLCLEAHTIVSLLLAHSFGLAVLLEPILQLTPTSLFSAPLLFRFFFSSCPSYSSSCARAASIYRCRQHRSEPCKNPGSVYCVYRIIYPLSARATSSWIHHPEQQDSHRHQFDSPRICSQTSSSSPVCFHCHWLLLVSNTI